MDKDNDFEIINFNFNKDNNNKNLNVKKNENMNTKLDLTISPIKENIKTNNLKNENFKYNHINNNNNLIFNDFFNEEIKEIKENEENKKNEEITLNLIIDTKEDEDIKQKQKVKNNTITNKNTSRRSNRIKTNNNLSVNNYINDSHKNPNPHHIHNSLFYDLNDEKKNYFIEKENKKEKINNKEKNSKIFSLLPSQEYILNSTGSIVKKEDKYFNINYNKYEEYINSISSKKGRKNYDNLNSHEIFISNTNNNSEIYNSKENSNKKIGSIQKIMETPKLCEKKRKRNTTNIKSSLNSEDVHIKTNSTMNQTPNLVKENNRLKKKLFDFDSNNIVKNLQANYD